MRINVRDTFGDMESSFGDLEKLIEISLETWRNKKKTLLLLLKISKMKINFKKLFDFR
jgi:hypothetical protein